MRPLQGPGLNLIVYAISVLVAQVIHQTYSALVNDLSPNALQWVSIDLQLLQCLVESNQRGQLIQIVVDNAEVAQRSQVVNESDRQFLNFVIADIKHVKVGVSGSAKFLNVVKPIHMEVKLLEFGKRFANARNFGYLVSIQTQVSKRIQLMGCLSAVKSSQLILV